VQLILLLTSPWGLSDFHRSGIAAMSIWPERKVKELERRISQLQAALRQHSEMARRRPGFGRKVTGAIAILMRSLAAFQRASRTVPIVFVITIDLVGGGRVASLARPGTNATGFASYEFGLGGKWLELLKGIAPGVKRVAVIRDAAVPAGIGGLASIQKAAGSFGVDLLPSACGIETGWSAA
jgi:ABC-type uncharacterized transport system substrate-binding protein